MIALDNGDKIRGDAAAAAVVDYTLHGFVGTVATQLADGQLPAAIGDLYTAGAAGIGVSSIILVNTDSVARTVNLYLTPSGGTARRLIPKDYSLGAGEAIYTDGTVLKPEPTVILTHASTHEDSGSDEISVAGLSGELADNQPPKTHKASHENAGGDEISVAGLSGELADDQPPKTHNLGGTEHGADTLANLNLKVSDATLDDSSATRTPSAHKTSHENGGGDEISVAGLSGELADNQPPKAHKTSHENGGGDEISVAGLSGELADAQPPKTHNLGGSEHGADTLANLNAKVSDATLDTNTAKRPPNQGKFSITVESPDDSENICLGFTFVAITVTEIQAVVKGSSPSVTIDPSHSTDRSAAGNDILAAATAITNTTTGQNLTSFDDPTIPADSWIWLLTTATSGTIDELTVTIRYTVD